METKLLDHNSDSTKRLLSLNGAGIRGALSLGYLKKSEKFFIKKRITLFEIFVLDSENAMSREHTLWLAQKRF